MKPNYFNTDMRLRVQTTNRQLIKCTRINCYTLYDVGDKRALLHCSQPSPASYPSLPFPESEFCLVTTLISQTAMLSNACHAPEHENFKTLQQPCKGREHYPYFTNKTQDHRKIISPNKGQSWDSNPGLPPYPQRLVLNHPQHSATLLNFSEL